jgi:Fic family protein
MSTPAVTYRWKEISDLPEDLTPLEDRELESLVRVWDRHKTTIQDQSGITRFNEQLAREWAIETGIIEGVYTLDRGITQTLIERGIDSSYIAHDSTNRDPDLVARIIQSHRDVLETLFTFVAGERELSVSYIKELHAGLLRYQEKVSVVDQSGRMFEVQLEKGLYKTQRNNPVREDGSTHEYCPPEHVTSEMDRLIGLYRQHSHTRKHSHIEAASLQHAFTQIHPFQDGNGRVARSLASLVFIKQGLFPLVVTRDDRIRYIEALELADQGDLSTLTRLFALLQKRALTRAIGMAVDAKPVKTLDEAIDVTREMLLEVGRISPKEYQAANNTADALFGATHERLRRMNEKLASEIGTVNTGFTFSTNKLNGPPAADLAVLAQTFGYEPNTRSYHQTVAATLTSPSVNSDILVSFHGVGVRSGALLSVVAYFKVDGSLPTPLSDDIFRISYEEPLADAESRYRMWLENCLIQALSLWRRQLV